MRLLIMGPQGVGKGTQAALLAEHFNIPTISTGDIFRYNIKNKTELGLEAMSYTDKGELVPDSPDQQDRQGSSGQGRLQERLDPRRLPA